MIVESDEMEKELFAIPKEPVDTAAAMIGFHASQMVQDDEQEYLRRLAKADP